MRRRNLANLYQLPPNALCLPALGTEQPLPLSPHLVWPKEFCFCCCCCQGVVDTCPHSPIPGSREASCNAKQECWGRRGEPVTRSHSFFKQMLTASVSNISPVVVGKQFWKDSGMSWIDWCRDDQSKERGKWKRIMEMSEQGIPAFINLFQVLMVQEGKKGDMSPFL